MLVKVVETPAEVLSALRRNNTPVSLRSISEIYQQPSSSLQCVVCSDPASRNGVLQCAVALLGGLRGERQALMNELNAITKRSGLDISRTSLGKEPGVTVLMVPWSFRGEFRALISTAVSRYSYPDETEAAHSSSAVDTNGTAFLPSSTEGDEQEDSPCSRPKVRMAPTLDLGELRKLLLTFAQSRESTWLRLRRSVLRSRYQRNWDFPLGCVLQESACRGGVSWSIQFASIEDLERACILTEARMRSGKARFLKVSPPEGADGAETMLPELRISALQNSEAVRVEMARLMQALLKSLERLSFESPTSPSMLDVLN